VQTDNILILFAELSVALAGFAGIVAALNRGSSGQWSLSSRLGFLTLLAGSFSALFWAVFALVLLNAGVACVWGLSSSLWILFTVPINLVFWKRVPEAFEGTAFAPIVHTVALAFVVVLQIYNAVAIQLAWPFLVAIATLLGSGCAAFFQLVISDPEPTTAGAPAARQGDEPDGSSPLGL
jgi:hypothetical protein